MKQNWAIKTLKDVGDIFNGNSINATVKKEKYLNLSEGFPYIATKDIGYDTFIDYENGIRISFSEKDSFRIAPKNSVLICSEGGSAGRKIGRANQDICFVNKLFALSIENETTSKYVFYWYHSNTFQKEFKSRLTGLIGGVSKKKFETIPIPIPLPLEQKRIVAKLDQCFESINKAKANAEKNLKNTKELFESYSQSAFEKNRHDWKVKTLGEVCSLYQGIAINAKTKHAIVEKSDLPLLRIKDLRNNTEEQYIEPNNYPMNALVNESDILYTRTGNSLGLVFRGRRGILHNNSFKVVPTNELSRDYIFNWLQNPIFKSRIFALASKAAQPDITHAIFKIQEISIPPLQEQQTIVNNLNSLFTETKKLESIYQQKLTDLEELKKSILQKAFDGQL